MQGLGVAAPSSKAQALLLWDRWGLPGPGMESVSPTLAGRFFTTEPPGKPKALGLYSTVFRGILLLKHSLLYPQLLYTSKWAWKIFHIDFLELKLFYFRR